MYGSDRRHPLLRSLSRHSNHLAARSTGSRRRPFVSYETDWFGAQRCRRGAWGGAAALAPARTRAEPEPYPPTFVLADAQTFAFEPASFDSIVSRFGVMFFDDPVQAFANLKRAAEESARLQFVAWRSAAENPFMTTAE